ncbi:MAG: hypothetical protein LBN42_02760 [Oscillospiraceae bacterium]|jgi:hypothetical protein|nr:hypothetical protein [Oscillospiraceae bacterium]
MSYTFNRAEALRYMGVRGNGITAALSDYAECFDIAEEHISDMLGNAPPRFVYRIFDMLLPSDWGNDIAEHTANSTRYAVMAVTLGLQIDRAISAEPDTSVKLAMDALCSDIAEQYANICEADIKRVVGAAKYTTRFSAGYGDFPLTAQTRILQMLNAAKTLGITLNADYLMLPRKSITAIIGIKG